jgi:hypothetical protein
MVSETKYWAIRSDWESVELHPIGTGTDGTSGNEWELNQP